MTRTERRCEHCGHVIGDERFCWYCSADSLKGVKQCPTCDQRLDGKDRMASGIVDYVRSELRE